MRFLKKLIKNKVLVLSISVIVVSLVYTGIQKAIDNYNFNNDIISTEEENHEVVNIETNDVDNSNQDEVSLEGEGIISEDETDLLLEEENIEEESIEGEEQPLQKTDSSEEKNKIYVYVTGEINVPGVVILNEGSRIVDAINAAGGTTPQANISKVNLVYVLDDGMKVNIPNEKDLKDNPNFEYITTNSGDGGKDDYFDKNNPNATEENDRGKANVVNINTATQTELETLPGIGPSLALKIINYRKENGKFSSIEQIKDVSGIGESKFESLKKFITI